MAGVPVNSGAGPAPWAVPARSGAVRTGTGADIARSASRSASLVRVARVADPQPVPGGRAGDRAGALLDDVGEFVGERALVGAAVAHHHVVARGVGAGAQLRRRAPGGAVVVNAHVTEVGAEPRLHLGAQRGGRRAAGAAQHAVHRGALDGRAVPAARAVRVPVPVLVVLEHAGHGGVAHGALQGQESGGARAGCRPRPGDRRAGRRGRPGTPGRGHLVDLVVRAHAHPLRG